MHRKEQECTSLVKEKKKRKEENTTGKISIDRRSKTGVVIGFFTNAEGFGTTVNRFLDKNELWPGTSSNQNEK